MDSIFGIVLDPKTGVVLSAKLSSPSEKKAQVSIVSARARQKFSMPLLFHGFAAPQALVLHTLRTFMATHVLELGRRTLATLESTAFLALGFGAVNGQDFRTCRDPLGRFTLFLISPAGLWKPGVPDAGPRRTSWSGNCRERARVLQSRCGRIELLIEENRFAGPLCRLAFGY